jgi:hypothetical protein
MPRAPPHWGICHRSSVELGTSSLCAPEGIRTPNLLIGPRWNCLKPQVIALKWLVAEAAKRLDMPATALDHSIWRFMSDPRKD